MPICDNIASAVRQRRARRLWWGYFKLIKSLILVLLYTDPGDQGYYPLEHGVTSVSTMHMCLKTSYVRDLTGEIRPVVVEAYIYLYIGQDLLSVKRLNRAGYLVINDVDEDVSGIYAVNKS
jgi:hypothetical protein